MITETKATPRFYARAHEKKQPVEVIQKESRLGSVKSEQDIAAILENEGCQVIKHGWPDFLVKKGNETYAVEVKTPNDRLHKHQQEMHRMLNELGLGTFTVCDGKIIHAEVPAHTGKNRPIEINNINVVINEPEQKPKPEFPQLVDAPTLLVMLFPCESSRPSLRFMRELQAKRLIPYKKIGRLIMFDPSEVRRAIDSRFGVKAKGGAL